MSIAKIIAKELNVSTASVSRALNDQPGVSEELRTIILQRARALNYAPSVAARGLATAQTFAVGFFVHEHPGLSAHSDPFYGEIMRGAEQALAQSPYHLTVATLTDDLFGAPHHFRFVREKRVDGMLLAGPDIPADFILAMANTGLPVVLIDNRLDYSRAHSITSDDEGGAYQAAQFLLNQGHHCIGIISGPIQWSSNSRRVEGYQRALRIAGLSSSIVHIEQTTIESGQQAFKQLIAIAPDITAICAVNDSMAIGAIRAAQATGRRIPEDLTVIGFDDIAWAEVNNPPLTTIGIPKRQIGFEAANRLLAIFSASDLEPTNLTVSVRLIERASSGPPALQ